MEPDSSWRLPTYPPPSFLMSNIPLMNIIKRCRLKRKLGDLSKEAYGFKQEIVTQSFSKGKPKLDCGKSKLMKSKESMVLLVEVKINLNQQPRITLRSSIQKTKK
jgi:hypothetical protein